MSRIRYDWRHRMGTHAPVLAAAVAATQGPVAEFGAGDTSTPLLDELVAQQGRRLVTLDTDAEWLGRFARLESEHHELRRVDDWVQELERDEWSQPWAVVFVDQNPWEARVATVNRLRESAELLVVHDCDYFPRAGLFGHEERPLLGPHDRGRRDYGDVFESWREIFPPEPWPYRPTGPPTLIGSNMRSVEDVAVDFDTMTPTWWRVARQLRGVVPQPVRLRIATLMGWGHS